MRNLVVLFIHFIAALARLLGPGGVRSLVAESLLLKHQLLIDSRPSLPAGTGLRWPLLADIPGPHERQSLEY